MEIEGIFSGLPPCPHPQSLREQTKYQIIWVRPVCPRFPKGIALDLHGDGLGVSSLEATAPPGTLFGIYINLVRRRMRPAAIVAIPVNINPKVPGSGTGDPPIVAPLMSKMTSPGVL
jgi:hypothetical protein